jgi:hypothetical protein
LSSSVTFDVICASLGRVAFGRTRKPNATFSKMLMWPNSA